MPDLHDIFDECVTRLAAGETIDAIVRDYPDQTDELRDLLTLGDIAGKMQMNASDMDSAHEAGRSKLTDLIFLSPKNSRETKMTQPQDKPKRKIKPITEQRWKMPAVAAAVLVILVAGVAIGMFFGTSGTTIEVPPQAVAADDACATLVSPVQNEQYAQNNQEQAQPPQPIVDEPVEVMEERPVTGVDSEPDPFELTSVPLIGRPTSSPAPTMPPPSAPVDSSVEESDYGADGYAYDTDDAVVGGETVVGEMGSTTSGTVPGTGGGGRSASEPETAVDYAGAPPVATSVGSFDDRTRSDGDESAEYYAEPDMTGDIEKSSETRTSGGSVAYQQPIQPLRAGEIDDNADWDVYQEYRHNYLEQYSYNSVNDRDVTDRQIIRVIDANNRPVLGACVQVYLGTSLVTQHETFATGLTMFFPELLDRTKYVENFRVVVSKRGLAAEAELNRNAIGDVLTVQLPLAYENPPSQMDVMFLIDATGSMSDEIQQLQDNILSISSQIDALPGNVDVRYGLVSYRDFGDDYVTRVYEFTDDVSEFQDNLLDVSAGGGGDTPEALNEGLDEALNAVEWRGNDAVKLMFLVADAPPHLDYNNGLDYSVSMFDALAQGIKIHPIASGGLSPNGEYILRQIAQTTMGHFIFLTYEGATVGTSGDDRTDLEVGTPEDEQGIGDYSVAQLDELVLRLITDELGESQSE